MMRIAHLSDLHLLEPDHASRRGVAQRRLAYLTVGRPTDAALRRRRARDVLTAARRSGADHVLVTGDLTEDGVDAQFEVLAEVLAESRLRPSQVTLVPGNHDAYDAADGFARALTGPLAPWAPASSPGVPVVLGDTVVLPVCTAVHQRYTRSAGVLSGPVLERIAAVAEETHAAGRTLVIAMHHPPHRRLPVVQWIDGLLQHAAIGAILERHEHAHVLCGHIHTATDRAVRPGAAPRVFTTQAVVDGTEPLRLYDVRHGRVRPASPEPHLLPALALA